MIKDSKKHAGEKLVMAFVEYSNTYFATEAMDALQVRVACRPACRPGFMFVCAFPACLLLVGTACWGYFWPLPGCLGLEPWVLE